MSRLDPRTSGTRRLLFLFLATAHQLCPMQNTGLRQISAKDIARVESQTLPSCSIHLVCAERIHPPATQALRRPRPEGGVRALKTKHHFGVPRWHRNRTQSCPPMPFFPNLVHL